jgi:hypothetical protein
MNVILSIAALDFFSTANDSGGPQKEAGCEKLVEFPQKLFEKKT